MPTFKYCLNNNVLLLQGIKKLNLHFEQKKNKQHIRTPHSMADIEDQQQVALREHKRRQRIARRQRNRDNNPNNTHTPGSSNRCWDWMLVNGNSHYAKNRSMFSSYCRAPCQVGLTRVLGVGTVNLETVRDPDDPRPYTLRLENVLHIPEALCNGISVDKLVREEDLDLDVIEEEDGHGRLCCKQTGEPVFYGTSHCGVQRLVLAGDPQGESYLKDGVEYMLSVHAGENQLQELERRVASKI